MLRFYTNRYSVHRGLSLAGATSAQMFAHTSMSEQGWVLEDSVVCLKLWICGLGWEYQWVLFVWDRSSKSVDWEMDEQGKWENGEWEWPISALGKCVLEKQICDFFFYFLNCTQFGLQIVVTCVNFTKFNFFTFRCVFLWISTFNLKSSTPSLSY